MSSIIKSHLVRLDGDAPNQTPGQARPSCRPAKGVRLLRVEGVVRAIEFSCSCGETTVRVLGHGRGGRNSEYGLALALALDGHPEIFAIACDTDGIDGTEDNAGCFVTPDSLQRASAKSLDARKLLDENDSYRYFSEIGDLVETGPTRTNVNDFRAILITSIR